MSFLLLCPRATGRSEPQRWPLVGPPHTSRTLVPVCRPQSIVFTVFWRITIARKPQQWAILMMNIKEYRSWCPGDSRRSEIGKYKRLGTTICQRILRRVTTSFFLYIVFPLNSTHAHWNSLLQSIFNFNFLLFQVISHTHEVCCRNTWWFFLKYCFPFFSDFLYFKLQENMRWLFTLIDTPQSWSLLANTYS